MADGPKLLSGGNPQIPKGDGDEVVQAYIDACPGWKQDLTRRLDVLIEDTVPGVKKGVRWNSPMYSTGDGWFVSYHCYTDYVKLTFFHGTSLDPVPPGGTGEGRWVNVTPDDLDEARLTAWIRQAAELPGWSGS